MVLLAEKARGGNAYFAVVCYVDVKCGMSAGAFDSQKICGKGKFSDEAVNNGSAFGASVSDMCL